MCVAEIGVALLAVVAVGAEGGVVLRDALADRIRLGVAIFAAAWAALRSSCALITCLETVLSVSRAIMAAFAEAAMDSAGLVTAQKLQGEGWIVSLAFSSSSLVRLTSLALSVSAPSFWALSVKTTSQREQTEATEALILAAISSPD